MKNGVRIAPDVTFRPWDKGVLASNYRARTHVLISFSFFQTLAKEEEVETPELQIFDYTCFSNLEGLLADPTCLASEEKRGKHLFSDFEGACSFLEKRFIVTRDLGQYQEYFSKKRTLVDQKHFGTFHQRLGGELRLRLKRDPAVWWYGQKFDSKTGEIKNNLYKFVQESFLKTYFEHFDFRGKTVLDFGCGSGMASRRFCERGARVIGIDPDQDLLERAKREIGDSFHPVLFPMDANDPLQALPEEVIDFVWLADVFMFYFYPQDGRDPILPPEKLLSRLTAFLKPQGLCVIMQPHGFFWLSPWLGSIDKPYTVLTEYAEKLYSVAPGLEELSRSISKAGLVIRNIYEPKPSLEGLEFDKRAFFFANHFPQWWVFECLKL